MANKTPTTRINELTKKLEKLTDSNVQDVTPVVMVMVSHETKRLPASTREAISNIEPNIFDITTTREPEEDGTFVSTISIFLTDPIEIADEEEETEVEEVAEVTE